MIFAILFPVGLCAYTLGIDADSVSVTGGHSVTLHTDTKTNQQEKIIWFFEDIRIAQINGDLSFICTDVQCNNGTEKFRDRLKLDKQTGSLTMRNTQNGNYYLQIIGSSSNSDKIFSVTFHGVSAAEPRDIKSVTEGDTVTLNAGKIKNSSNVMTWYFNSIIITKQTEDLSHICEDVKCKDIFSNRIKLNQSSGSLTIKNVRNSDAGEYELEISSSSFSIHRYYDISVISFSFNYWIVILLVIGILLVGLLATCIIVMRFRGSDLYPCKTNHTMV